MAFGKWLFKKISKYYSSETKDDKRAYLCDFDRICHEIIPGDVLLVEGTNRISRYIKSLTHSPWTHASLYIGRLHSIEDPKMREIVRKHYHGSAGQQLLVDTIVGQGTFIRPIGFYKNHHIRICRPTGLSHRDTQRVIDFAIQRLGHTYNIRHFLDLARFILSNHWFFPRRWRSTLFMSEDPNQTTKDICSAMIAEAFVSIKFPILPFVRHGEGNSVELIQRNPKLFTPSDFDYSPYFSIIKYPIFRFTDHGPYHDLPWREDLLSQDEGILTPTKENKKPSDSP
ncbi:MAG: hypothetical protein A3F10_01980 [Coxiella sp. RIFCSPHIGHO2_12_FULL_42_15]|nr:MAG: hypothetical protein A3F10_01980 [Coxiella sp. RIFCSPHIGHO2_12_FULL_42_15]